LLFDAPTITVSDPIGPQTKIERTVTKITPPLLNAAFFSRSRGLFIQAIKMPAGLPSDEQFS
jgi:hypothetical protein